MRRCQRYDIHPVYVIIFILSQNHIYLVHSSGVISVSCQREGRVPGRAGPPRPAASQHQLQMQNQPNTGAAVFWRGPAHRPPRAAYPVTAAPKVRAPTLPNPLPLAPHSPPLPALFHLWPCLSLQQTCTAMQPALYGTGVTCYCVHDGRCLLTSASARRRH